MHVPCTVCVLPVSVVAAYCVCQHSSILFGQFLFSHGCACLQTGCCARHHLQYAMHSCVVCRRRSIQLPLCLCHQPVHIGQRCAWRRAAHHRRQLCQHICCIHEHVCPLTHAHTVQKKKEMKKKPADATGWMRCTGRHAHGAVAVLKHSMQNGPAHCGIYARKLSGWRQIAVSCAGKCSKVAHSRSLP